MFQSNFSPASSSSTFGQSTFGRSSFGTTPQTTGFGAPSNNLFGATQQPTSNMFGATQPQSTSFGNTGLFGSQPQATTSTFGTQQPTATSTTGGLFGSSGSAFGQTKPAFGFGSNTTGGLFGQSTMFGQNNPAQAGTSTLFGGTSAFGGAAATGTTTKFVPVTGTDTMMRNGNSQTINTRHVCITCMKEYETKSLDELRYEDYKANRKGPQQGNQATAGFFGSNAQPSLFGSNTTAGAALPAPNLFGATENKSLFGQTATAFGQPSNTNTLFGKPNTGFGATVTTQSNTFSFNPTNTFGQANTTGIKPFGAAAPQPNNLFGTSTSQATPTFGAPQPSTFGSFGSNQNQGLNFNKPAFNIGGNTTSTGFGFGTNTATNNTSLFGQKHATTAFGLPNTATPFGAQPSFGAQPAQNTNLFNSFNKPPSSFQFNPNTTPNASLGGGNTFGGTSLFGNTANAKPTGSLFGNTTNTNGLFGNTSFGNNTGTTSAFGHGINTGFNLGGTSNTFNNALLPQASPSVNNINSQQILNLASLPYFAAPSLYKGVIPTTSANSKLEDLVLPAFQKNRINSKNMTINSNAAYNKIKIKPVGSSNASTKSLFDDFASDTDDSEKYFNPRKSSSKSLILLPKKTKPIALNVHDVTNAADITTINTANDDKDNKTPLISSSGNSLVTPASTKLTLNIKENISPVLKVSDMKIHQHLSMKNGPDMPHQKEFNIKLTRHGYYLSPTLSELKQLMAQGGPCTVDGFTIGHEELGSICFLESIDLSELNNIDLDSIFEFRFKEVILYPDDNNKPPVGTVLNRPAKVTLLKVWPKDKSTGQLITDVEKIENMNYEAIVRRACKRMNVEFVSYQPETGSWCFKVQHFSKYSLLKSDEEGESEPKKPKMFVSTPLVLPQIETQTLLKEKATQSPNQKVRNEILAKEINRNEMMSNNMIPIDETMDYIESSTGTLARHMGTDPYKVQMMKQCFEDTFESFGFPMSLSREFFIENKAHYSGGSLFKQTVDMPPSVRTLSPTSELDLEDEEDQSMEQSGFLVLDNKPNKLEVVPVKFYQCRLSQQDNMKMTGIYHQKNFLNVEYNRTLDQRFSTSWLKYKRSFLMTCNDNLMPDDYSDVSNLFDIPPVSNNLLQIVDTSTPCLTEKEIAMFIDHLQVCVQNCDITIKQNCPFVTLRPGNNVIHDHCNLLSVSSNNTYDTQVWKLCVALWGTLNVKNSTHEVNMKRKNNLTDWLESVMNTKDKKSHGNPEQNIFKLVTEHKLHEAIISAQQSDNLYLSGAVSMLGCSEIGQAFMQAQLSHYVEATSDSFVNQDVLKLMLLVSGQPLYDSSNGIINVCEDLDWKLAFGIHFWYLEPYFKSIADVVYKFQTAWNSDEAYCLPPSPHYGNVDFKDLCYHLLMLYSNQSHNLVELLNPGTYSENPLDFRMSWFIMQALKALGYSHLDEKIANKYHLSFASQLLSYNLWEFAIFVLMHIEDDALRRHHIDHILERHVILCSQTLELTAKESFLVDTLHIPAEWIHKSKGHLAMYKGEYWDACEYFLEAKEYFKCHQVLFDKVVSLAVMNHQYTFLEDMLGEMFANISETDKKTWWKSGGEWLMNYFHIANELGNVQDGMFNEVFYLVPDFIQELEVKYTNCDDVDKSYYCELFERLVLLLRKSGQTDFIFHNNAIPIAPYLIDSFQSE